MGRSVVRAPGWSDRPAPHGTAFIIAEMNSPHLGRPVCRVLFSAAIGGLLSACSPALDWRDTPVPGSPLTALFPCKPDSHVRRVVLAGSPRDMHLTSCTANDSVYAVSHVDVGDPARVTEAMHALRALAAENIGGAAQGVDAPPVRGMTPHPLAERLSVLGQRADGSAIEARAAFFTQATVVYQATVVGTRLDPEAVDTFFTALKLR